MIDTHAKWLAANLPELRALKRPSEFQRCISELADKPDRSDKEERQLGYAIGAEMAARRMAQRASIFKRSLRERTEAERKARNHKLIQLGALLEIAGIDQWDRGELLGGFIEMANGKDADTRSKWKRQGDSVLADREAKARTARAAQAAAANGESTSAQETVTA